GQATPAGVIGPIDRGDGTGAYSIEIVKGHYSCLRSGTQNARGVDDEVRTYRAAAVCSGRTERKLGGIVTGTRRSATAEALRPIAMDFVARLKSKRTQV